MMRQVSVCSQSQGMSLSYDAISEAHKRHAHVLMLAAFLQPPQAGHIES